MDVENVQLSIIESIMYVGRSGLNWNLRIIRTVARTAAIRNFISEDKEQQTADRQTDSGDQQRITAAALCERKQEEDRTRILTCGITRTSTLLLM